MTATTVFGPQPGAGPVSTEPDGKERNLRERVAAVLPVLREQAGTVDDRAEFPVAGLDALRASGLMGLLVPTSYGGLGGDLRDLVRISADLAGGCVSTAMIWSMHCQQVAALARYATPQLQDELLPRIGAGQVYVASVTSEKGKGGHLFTADAALRHDGDKLGIERDAPIVTGGHHADGFLITMRNSTDAGYGAVSLVYADRQELTVEASGTWNPMGMRGTHSGPLRLTGEVDSSRLVGKPGDFRTIAVSVFAPVGHLGWAACWLGAARAAYAGVLDLIRSPAGRRQFDIRSDLLRVRLARVRLELDTISALLTQSLRDVQEAPDLQAPDVQMRLNGLKVFAAEHSFAVVDTLIEMTGLRHGYMREAPLALERVFRDLRSASLNYSNDRLLAANGALTLTDRRVNLAY